jgi:hypothetical protein
MLYKETVSQGTLELIQKLQADSYFKEFLLVGGTGLSLQIGHRISVDIDLFTTHSFDVEDYLQRLEKYFGFELQYSHANTLKGFINGVFVDILKHDYKILKPPVNEEGVILSSKADIAAMKVNAVCINGTRAKDFVDIYFLLKEFSFGQIIAFYTDKYKTRNDFLAVKSLTYYSDIIESDWPNLVKEKNLTLDEVKKTITSARDKYLNEKIK